MALFLVYLLIGVSISSYILWFVLPRGIGLHGYSYCHLYGTGLMGNYYSAFGLTRYIWVEVHSWLSIALAILIFIHIILHINWIYETVKRIKSYILKKQGLIIERYLASIILFILFSFEIVSGFIIWLIMPRGVEDYYAMTSGIGRTFWGLQRNIWVDIHAWIAVIIVSFVIIHLIMHWRWIVGVIKGNNKVTV
ncbi:MAG: DUF4405 domain-containing protein [Dehalococcoidales bacterium]|nr:DUF4405 domain-containing protein [Dehalococcoidales bacterium]